MRSNFEKIKGRSVNYKRTRELSKYDKRIEKLREKKTRKGSARYVYPEYIRSIAWLERRKRFYADFGSSCAVCGSNQDTTVHHMSYIHLGNEKDSELVALCRPHHGDYHRQNGTQSNMIKKTHAYIKTEKEKYTREKAKAQALGTLQTTNPS